MSYIQDKGIKQIELAEDLTAEDLVEIFLDGSTEKIKAVGLTDFFDVQQLSDVGANGVYNSDAVLLGNKIIISYAVGTPSFFYALRVITIKDRVLKYYDNLFPAVSGDYSQDDKYLALAKVNSNTIMLAAWTPNAIKAGTYTVDGYSISVDISTQTIRATISGAVLGAKYVSDNNVILYYVDSNTNTGYSTILTVSSSITINTEYVFSSSAFSRMSYAGNTTYEVDTNKFITFFRLSTGAMQAVASTVSGTVISNGTPVTVSSILVRGFAAYKVSTSLFVCIYGNNNNVSVAGRTISISGTTLAANTENTTMGSTSTGTCSGVFIYKTDSSNYVFTYSKSGDFVYNIFTLTGTTVNSPDSPYRPKNINTNEVGDFTAGIELGNGEVFMINSGYLYYYGFNQYDFDDTKQKGILLETGTAGQTKNVKLL